MSMLKMKTLLKSVVRSIITPGQTIFLKSYFKKSKIKSYFDIRQHVQARDPVSLIKSVKPDDIEQLKRDYKDKNLDRERDTFVFYRIIGNDLYPRHKIGQSRRNLQFILEHEEDFIDCEKVFIVNRIIKKTEEREIIKLIKQYNKRFIHIPFFEEDYKKIGWDTECFPEPAFLAGNTYISFSKEKKQRVIGAVYRLKNNYVMNNNGARNAALKDGKKYAKWILPWDGNCFITPSAWKEIKTAVTIAPYLKYFVVPMARVTNNENLLSDNFNPNPVEEPQLIFRKDTSEYFNEDYCYGRRPKIELFWRLGIPGKWNYWKDNPWECKRRDLSPEAKQFGVAGWVARLHSGMSALEQDSKKSFKQRGILRLESIINTLQNLDVEFSGMSAEKLTSFSQSELDMEHKSYLAGDQPLLNNLIYQLVEDAENALKSGPYSVIDKTTVPPSRKPYDYRHPDPDWLPNPETPDGLPCIRKYLKCVSETIMYKPGSDKYDQARLQRVFNDSTILALAWKFTGDLKYARHGANIFNRFFINSATRMNPHLNYTKLRWGRNNKVDANTEIIEMKDVYYYLDAVRMIYSSGAMPEQDMKLFKKWLSEYIDWLLNSSQGKREMKAANGHGIYYDLQVASIAALLEEKVVLYEALIRAQSRISQHFATDGSQPEQARQKASLDIYCFNLQGWVNLAILGSYWGADLWTYSASTGASLKKGIQWLFDHANKPWPYKQSSDFDQERLYPIWYTIPKDLIELKNGINIPDSQYKVKPRYNQQNGIKPYWNLGLSRSYCVKG